MTRRCFSGYASETFRASEKTSPSANWFPLSWLEALVARVINECGEFKFTLSRHAWKSCRQFQGNVGIGLFVLGPAKGVKQWERCGWQTQLELAFTHPRFELLAETLA